MLVLHHVTSRATRALTQAIASFALENDFSGISYVSREVHNTSALRSSNETTLS